jgi:uncharacterized protein (TIGR02301 family)
MTTRGAIWLLSGVLLLATASAGTAASDDTRPYDQKLLRLSEILGAVHYLRELCGANDGQGWRERMQALIETEGFTPLRRARLVVSFNKGYRSYRRTYVACNASAKTALDRFFTEGAAIAEQLVKEGS